MTTVSTQAQIALHSLHPRDRERVQSYISLLDEFLKSKYVHQKVKRLNAYDDVYLMRVTPTLRIIFRSSDDSSEVVDIVTHDRLERMHRHARQA